jgi:hypothetical protein
MQRGVVVMVMAWAALAWGASGHDLDDKEFKSEITHNRSLAAYVDRNGMPDLAETRSLSDEPPWDDHEVRLYYFDRKQEVGFARAWILGDPTVQIERYKRPLTDAQIAALSRRARHYSKKATPTAGLRADERAQASADRAEAAAARIEKAASSAERAAEHTESVTGKMERAFHSSLTK